MALNLEGARTTRSPSRNRAEPSASGATSFIAGPATIHPEQRLADASAFVIPDPAAPLPARPVFAGARELRPSPADVNFPDAP